MIDRAGIVVAADIVADEIEGRGIVEAPAQARRRARFEQGGAAEGVDGDPLRREGGIGPGIASQQRDGDASLAQETRALSRASPVAPPNARERSLRTTTRLG